MKLPDGTTLMHADHAPYDARKAHEYYLRTRQLKGRKKGSAKPGAGFKPTGQKGIGKQSGTFTVKTRDGKTVKLTSQQLAEQKAYADHRVTVIKTKLHKLQSELKKRMAEAKKHEKNAKKPDTAAEKHKKAKESEKYRDKHKQELKNKAKKAAGKKSGSSKPDTHTVEGLKKTIAHAQKSLKAAIERQRTLAGATKNG